MGIAMHHRLRIAPRASALRALPMLQGCCLRGPLGTFPLPRDGSWLGEMPTGYCIVRLSAKTSWLESTPVHILTDPPALREVSDDELRALAEIPA